MFVRKTEQPKNSRVLQALQKSIPLFFLSVVGLLASCAQDSIFYEVSNEVAPKDPLISGGPSQIVEFDADGDTNNELYVVRKYVYGYNNSSGSYRWSRINQINPFHGNAIDIAAVPNGLNKGLYVLTMDNWDAYSMKLWSSTNGTAWTGPVTEPSPTPSYAYLENIYNGGDTLFVGAYNGTSPRSYGILYYDGTDLIPCTDGVNPIRGRLGGAAQTFDGTYYVAAGSTLYYGTSPSSFVVATTFPEKEMGAICGIIDIDPTLPGGNLAVITSNGYLYQGSTVTFTQLGRFGGKLTGALAVYDGGGFKLLLIGTSSDSTYYTYGYREVLISGGNLSGGFNEPGGSGTSSIVNQPRYRSTIGRRVINSIRQGPDGILFASTQTKGLWSYRDETWNAEE